VSRPAGSSEWRPGSTRDVIIITVQYSNFADTRTFVTSLAALDDSRHCELVIVDNDESGTGAADLESIRDMGPFPVHLMRPSRNLYYWGGAAYALEQLSKSAAPRPRWVIICNNDVTFADASFLARLRALDVVHFPIIAPTIVSEATGRDQNPFLIVPAGRLKRLKWRVYDVGYPIATTMLAIHGLAKRMAAPLSHALSRPAGEAKRRQIYAPHGAFVILSEAFFQRGGALDTTVPMFAEELTIAALAQRLSLPVWHVPELKVSHREHSTTGVGLTKPKYELERLARRHYYDLRV